MRYQENRLRNRKPGIDELAVEYYYDMVDLCRIVDPPMLEPVKLDYLFGGFKPTLLKKIWVRYPQTSGQLVAVNKLHTWPLKWPTKPNDWLL